MQESARENHRFRLDNCLSALCACALGVSSWIAINAIWVEIPILCSRLPEHARLPSYIVLVSQLANVGPLTYTALLWRLGSRSRCLSFAIWIVGVLIVGALAMFALAFAWQHTAALLVLAFLLSLVDCTSSVLCQYCEQNRWFSYKR